MKNSPLPTVLLGVLAILVLFSLWACWSYISNARELRSLQTSVNLINGRKAWMNALITDCMEYSKKNSAIDPVLEAAGLKAAAKPASSGTNKPAAK